MKKKPIHRPTVDDEVRSELEFHLEMRIRELVARGVPRPEAERQARARIGDINEVRATMAKLGKERNRVTDRRETLGELGQDIRFALRSLRQQPGFAIVALLTLAVGIGATTAIFSLLYSVVLRPLPIPDLDRIMVIRDGNERDRPWNVSAGNYDSYRRDSKSFEVMGATYGNSFNLSEGGTAERVLGGRADVAFFSVFRIPPALGRAFTAEEDAPGATGVVLLADRFWRRRFGADPRVVGRTITMDGRGYEVIGVMPPSFGWGSEDLWVPAAFTQARLAEHDEHFLDVYARLKPGVTEEQALGDMDRVARSIEVQFPDKAGGLRGFIQPMFAQFVGSAPERLWVLFGAVAVVLLIACVNVANLLLARGTARERELAVRAALGAGRRRIIRQLVTENLVLAVAAGIGGIGVAALALKVVIASAPEGVPRLEEAGIDGVTLAFAMATALGSTFLFGLLPALRAARPELAQTLREGGKNSTGGGREWLRRGLVTAEVGLAMMLLIGAGLLIRTAIHLGRVDPGFRPEGLLTAQITLPRESYLEWERSTQAFTNLAIRLRQASGVESAALSSQVPLGPGGSENGLIPEGRPIAMESTIQSRLRIVSPGYLETAGIPLISGRDFTADDRRGSPRVMIVSARMAELGWPGQSAIGKRVVCCEGSREDPAWKEIIGVAASVRSVGLDRDAGSEFYLPIGQVPDPAWDWIQRTMTVVVRGKNNADLTEAIRGAVRELDPAIPIHGIATMDERIRRSLAQSHFNTQLLSALGFVGLALASIGIYGVISYFVARRARELGIRMALGASAPQIRALILRQGLGPVVAGIALGTLGGLALTGVLATQLRGVSPRDPITFAAVATFLLLVAVVAALGPARRATRVDPTTTIRDD